MTVFARSLVASLALASALFAGAAAGQETYKIGVLHIERVLQQSEPAKAAQARIERDFKPRDADLVKREQDLQARQAQYEKERASLTAEARTERERDLETRTRDVQRQRQQFAEDLRARQFEELDKLKERMDQVLTKLAKDQNYDLILQDALYVGKTVDITDEVIKALAGK
jgi:outer membrane protein